MHVFSWCTSVNHCFCFLFIGDVQCLYYCSFLDTCMSILKCRIVLIFSFRLDKQVQLLLISFTSIELLSLRFKFIRHFCRSLLSIDLSTYTLVLRDLFIHDTIKVWYAEGKSMLLFKIGKLKYRITILSLQKLKILWSIDILFTKSNN